MEERSGPNRRWIVYNWRFHPLRATLARGTTRWCAGPAPSTGQYMNERKYDQKLNGGRAAPHQIHPKISTFDVSFWQSSGLSNISESIGCNSKLGLGFCIAYLQELCLSTQGEEAGLGLEIGAGWLSRYTPLGRGLAGLGWAVKENLMV